MAYFNSITDMVEYVITEHGGDPDRVFAAGASSGACMTQALLAAYPEVTFPVVGAQPLERGNMRAQVESLTPG